MNILDQSIPLMTTKVIRQYLSDNREPKAINVELNRMQYNGLKYAELLISHIEDDLRDVILDRRVYFLGSGGINDITDILKPRNIFKLQLNLQTMTISYLISFQLQQVRLHSILRYPLKMVSLS